MVSARIGRSCINDIFVHNELIQGHIRECKSTFAFFLDIKEMQDGV